MSTNYPILGETITIGAARLCSYSGMRAEVLEVDPDHDLIEVRLSDGTTTLILGVEVERDTEARR